MCFNTTEVNVVATLFDILLQLFSYILEAYSKPRGSWQSAFKAVFAQCALIFSRENTYFLLIIVIRTTNFISLNLAVDSE